MEKAMGKIMTAAAETRAVAGTMTNFRWKIAFLIFLISFVAYMDRVNLSVATPVIMQEFGFIIPVSSTPIRASTSAFSLIFLRMQVMIFENRHGLHSDLFLRQLRFDAGPWRYFG